MFQALPSLSVFDGSQSERRCVLADGQAPETRRNKERAPGNYTRVVQVNEVTTILGLFEAIRQGKQKGSYAVRCGHVTRRFKSTAKRRAEKKRRGAGRPRTDHMFPSRGRRARTRDWREKAGSGGGGGTGVLYGHRKSTHDRHRSQSALTGVFRGRLPRERRTGTAGP